MYMQRCFSNHICNNFKLNIVLDYEYNLGIYALYTNLNVPLNNNWPQVVLFFLSITSSVFTQSGNTVYISDLPAR